MALPANLQSVRRSTLEDLVEGGAQESRVLEFKRELDLTSDRAKTELACDLSAFANTVGGDVIYGVEEIDGVATAVSGFEPWKGVDDLIRRVTSVLEAGIRPRIVGFEIKAVEIEGARIALVVRLPNSRSKPHMVVREGHGKFWKREHRQRTPMDVDELRSAFLSTASLPERLRAFVRERRAALDEGIGIAAPFLAKHGWLVHLIPVEAVEGRTEIDVRQALDLMGNVRGFVHGAQPFVNFDGVACANPDPTRENSSYVQLFRNGIVEGLTSSVFQQDMPVGNVKADVLADGHALYETVALTRQFLAIWSQLGLRSPAYATATVTSSLGVYISSTIPQAMEFGHTNARPIRHKDLFLPPIELVDFTADGNSVARSLAPMAHALANAGGRLSSRLYSDDGTLRFIE